MYSFLNVLYGRTVPALVVSTILLFATTGQYAFADNVQNDVTAGGNDTITTGSTTTINYRITANNGDGQTGCNAADSSSAVVTIIAPAAVTASPGSLTFTSCGTNKSVVFGSSTAGDYLIGVSVSDSGTGTYNVNPAKFTLHVISPPNADPVLTVPSNQDIEGNTPGGGYVDYTSLAGGLSATDEEDGDLTSQIGCTPPSGSFFAMGGPHSILCSVEDSAGASDSATFEITIVDTTNPEISVPSDIVVEATGPAGAVVSFLATANDIVDGDLPVDCTPVSGSTFSLGTTPVSCSATDSHGNADSEGFNVIVQDTTAPVLSLPADITEEATGPSGAAVSFTASASDLVDGSVPVDCSPASGSTFPLGSTSVSCQAEDNAGNLASSSFSVMVQDTTPPELTLPSDITEEATGPGGATVSFVTSASDIVDGTVSVECTPDSGSTFALGTTTVDCSATDAAGNTAYGSFSITVQDTTPPTLILPLDKTVEATGPAGAAVSFTATALDIVDGSVTVDCLPTSGSTFALGTTTVGCSATDAAGNTATGSFSVTVQDTTPPTLNLPNNIVVSASGISGAVVTYSATATDIVDGPVTPNCSPSSGSTFPIGTTTVNCSAQDNAGNIANGSFTIKVTVQTSGFYQPVDMNNFVNVVKSGSTVPLKFEVFGNKAIPSTEISDTSIVKSLKQKLTSCDPSAPTDEVETTATGGTVLRYDSIAGQFVYNWKTPSQTGCYTVTLTLQDDSTIQALFRLK